MPANLAGQLTVALKAIAKPADGASVGVAAAKLLPVIEAVTVSGSPASVASSSSTVVALPQLLPDRMLPGANVTLPFVSVGVTDTPLNVPVTVSL
jgi:hypothetical protein